MNFFKAVFWLVVLFFNISLFKASEIAGIIFVIIEVVVFVKLKMGKSGSSSSFRSESKEKHFRIINRRPNYSQKTNPVDIILKLMQIESGISPSNLVYQNKSQNHNKHYLSNEHKAIIDILSGKNPLSNGISSETPLIDQTLSMYKSKDLLSIAKMLIELVTIRLRLLMFQITGYSSENISLIRLLRWLGNILLKNYGIDFVFLKINQIQDIENKIKDLSTSSSNQKNSLDEYNRITLEDCRFIANSYFSIKTLNPSFLDPQLFKNKNDSIYTSNNLMRNENIKSQRTEKMISSKRLMNGMYLSNNLKKLNPLVKLVSLDSKRRKSKGFSSKVLPFRSEINDEQELIPEPVSDIVKEYIEDKFNEEVCEALQKVNQTGDLNSGIENMITLERTRNSLSSSFSLALPSDKFNINSALSMGRFLVFFSILNAIIGFIILCQILYLSDAISVFLSFGLIFLGVAGLSIYISRKL